MAYFVYCVRKSCKNVYTSSPAIGLVLTVEPSSEYEKPTLMGWSRKMTFAFVFQL